MTTNRFNFTKAAIDSLSLPVSGRATYYDAKISGLQLRVSPTGTKSFSVHKRMKHGDLVRVNLGRYPAMTIEQARRQTIEIISRIHDGENPADRIRDAKREMTLNDLFNEYMERSILKRPDKPRDNYRLYLSEWGKRKLSSIRHEEVDRHHKKLGREKGEVTANIALKLLHAMFNKAINEWRIWQGTNPAHGISKFPEHSRDRFLQVDELPRFFAALQETDSHLVRDYILLSLYTGARRSNVLAMRWDEISLKRAEWRIPTTKNGTPQTIPLSPEAVEVLRARESERGSSPFVFPGTGASGHLVEPKKAWAKILKAANITDLRLHDLRRTFGSWQAKTGASLAIIGKSLNHKTPTATAIYARLDTDSVRASGNRAVAAMLDAAEVKTTQKDEKTGS